MNRIETPDTAEALTDAELATVCGGKAAQPMANYWKAISDMFKGQADTQSKIAGNLR